MEARFLYLIKYNGGFRCTVALEALVYYLSELILAYEAVDFKLEKLIVIISVLIAEVLRN